MRTRKQAGARTAPQSFVSQATSFLAGTTSPSLLLETYLERIDMQEKQLRAFVHMEADAARLDAKASSARWREGRPLSPIDGMPVGIKDIIETANMPTGQGSHMWAGFESRRDAATVQGLRDAGAIVVGKTVTAEFANAVLLAETVNPHDPARTPGGSSSGSAAAVGAGFLPVALGSQLVGSTLRPSSYCGCIGFKPSVGAINRGGSYDYYSQSCVGFIGAALEDVWVTGREIAKRVGGDPGYGGLGGPDALPAHRRPARLLVLETDGWSRATPNAKEEFEAAAARLEDAGVILVRRGHDSALEDFEQMISGIGRLTDTILAWESRWPLGSYIGREPDSLSPSILSRFRESSDLTQEDYIAALEERQAMRDTYAELLRDADGALTLAATGAAPVGFATTGDPSFNIPASILGVPAIGLPLLSDEGMPLGLQIMGKIDEDAAMIGIAHWVEAWFQSRCRVE